MPLSREEYLRVVTADHIGGFIESLNTFFDLNLTDEEWERFHNEIFTVMREWIYPPG